MVEENLAYDLRQKYAEIVGTHLERVSFARMEKDYPSYFRALEDLYTVTRHKFKEKKNKDDDGKKSKRLSDAEKYEELRKEAIALANEYRNAYLGETDNPEDIAKIENAFRKMEMFLFKVMDGSKMFGSTWDGGGL